MLPEQLIAEGRRLQRECKLLCPTGPGPPAAVWHEREHGAREVLRPWLTIEARHIPGLAKQVGGYITISTDERHFVGGRVDVTSGWPRHGGTPLFTRPASVLPPIDAVFAMGSDAVGAWLDSLGWDRTTPYNDNFKSDAVEAYERAYMDEHPLYGRSDAYAVLGGWHVPWPDDDWHDLIDEHLIVMTIRDSEPWVEAWRNKNGNFKVIRRIT
jgi:hypothetical protein